MPPAPRSASCRSAGLSGSQKVKRSRQNGCQYNPEQREPVKEGHPDEGRVNAVVKRRIQQDNKRDNQEDTKPGAPCARLSLRLRTHRVSPFTLSTR